jgi:hypothetical protein
MKTTTVFLMPCSILLSCGEAEKKVQDPETVSDAQTTETIKYESTNTSNSKPLCNINGEVWSYTSSDGLVSRNSDTKVRTATIGFTKKLDKGSESIQLEYDVDKNVLNNVWVQLKRPDKEGNIITAFYTQYGNKIDLNPGASLSGTLALSEDTRKASGNATITIFNDDKKSEEFNVEYKTITITNLNFSDISYSDTDDLKKLIKN